MQLWKLASMVNALHAAVDRNTTPTPSVEDLFLHLKRGDLMIWLERGLTPGINWNWQNLTEADKSEVMNLLVGLYEGYAGDQGKKWGIEHSGLLLMASWLQEAIIQKALDAKWTYNGELTK